jgi:general secretion pathway protein A
VAALAAALAVTGAVAGLGRVPFLTATQASTPVSVPAPPPVAAEAPARPGLADLLGGAVSPRDEDESFARLFAAWGVEDWEPRGGSACDAAPPVGLECLRLSGNWSRLRRLDLPAVLEVILPDTTPRRVTLVSVRGEEATLDLGGREVSFPLAEIDRVWTGIFTVVWRPPAVWTRLLSIGMRGRDVVWVRERLDEVSALVPGPAASDVYDEALRERVLAFQRSKALIPDGIVGEETLLHLTRGAAGADVPSLARPTSRQAARATPR